VAITLISNPLGHKLSGSNIDANIYDDSTGDAIVYTGTSHGLSDGEYVYIQSDFDSYNGFFYVDSTAYDYFKIKTSENGSYVQYVQDAEIEYQVAVLDHGFLAVHQPIVYELESTLYPNNTEGESYTPVTVTSFTDSDGYTELNLTGDIQDPVALSKIQLVGTGPLAGVYQILSVVDEDEVVIDLAYDIDNDFSGYTIVRYFDNYAINVNVYAGLPTDHRWQARKPYELAATLKFIPDDNNRVKFSIAELLRAYINNRNNLTLDTLPNNLDFSVSFYIEYFESYDDSDGEEITTYNSNEVMDLFVGTALNAKLEFKNETISHLSEYVESGVYLAQWLTLFSRPVAMAGYFFDLSFLNMHNERDIIVYISKANEGVVLETETLTISEPGAGVIRVPFTPESGFDEYCLEAHAGTGIEMVPAVEFDLADFENSVSGAPDWTTGNNPSFSISDVDALYHPLLVSNGQTIVFHYEFVITLMADPTPDSLSMYFWLADDPAAAVGDATTLPITGPGTYSGDISVTATADREYFAIDFNDIGLLVSGFLVSIGYGDETEVITPGFQITEQICVEVIEECDSTYLPEDARLLEDGGYRLLE
jgi:hypothetical protein